MANLKLSINLTILILFLKPHGHPRLPKADSAVQRKCEKVYPKPLPTVRSIAVSKAGLADVIRISPAPALKY